MQSTIIAGHPASAIIGCPRGIQTQSVTECHSQDAHLLPFAVRSLGYFVLLLCRLGRHPSSLPVLCLCTHRLDVKGGGLLLRLPIPEKEHHCVHVRSLPQAPCEVIHPWCNFCRLS